MTNQPLTAADCPDDFKIVEFVSGHLDELHLQLTDTCADIAKAYAAQQNAELVAENDRLKLKSIDLHKTIIDLQAENERLKQHNKALIPLAAWGKKHGHSMFCDMRNAGVMKNCRCTCGWVGAHQNQGLTTDQHLALAEYSDSLAQPPKEAT